MNQGRSSAIKIAGTFLGGIIILTWTIAAAMWIKDKVQSTAHMPANSPDSSLTDNYDETLKQFKFLYPVIDQNSPEFDAGVFSVVQVQVREFQEESGLSKAAALSKTMREIVGITDDKKIVVSMDRESLRKLGDHKVMVRSYFSIVNDLRSGGIAKTVQLMSYDCINRTKEVLSSDVFINGKPDGSMNTSYYKQHESPYVNPGSPQEWIMDQACKSQGR